MRVYTRQQFHELVWSKPITTLAKKFSLSDVALHKVCRKHDVPTPPPGWWAKKAAGKKVATTKLPKHRDGISDRIVITGGELRREPEVLAAAREKARVIASSAAPDDGATHPIIDRTIARLRKGKAGPTGLVSTDAQGLIECEVAPTSIDRLELALSRIVAAADQQGLALEHREKGAGFAGAGETVDFSIVETVRRVKHELTDKEQAELQKWERKHERDRRAGRWDSWVGRPQFPEWDYYPTGQLSLELEHVYVDGSPRRTFRDGKVQRLEDMAGEIAVGVVVLAAAKTQDRLDREAARLREHEQRRLREQAMRAKHVEDRRLAALDQILGELEQAVRMARLLDRLRSKITQPSDPPLAEFLRWADLRLASWQEALGAEGLARRFAESRLFGEDDDHGFQPYRYY